MPLYFWKEALPTCPSSTVMSWQDPGAFEWTGEFLPTTISSQTFSPGSLGHQLPNFLKEKPFYIPLDQLHVSIRFIWLRTPALCPFCSLELQAWSWSVPRTNRPEYLGSAQAHTGARPVEHLIPAPPNDVKQPPRTSCWVVVASLCYSVLRAPRVTGKSGGIVWIASPTVPVVLGLYSSAQAS